jgi:hypothetical protein
MCIKRNKKFSFTHQVQQFNIKKVRFTVKIQFIGAFPFGSGYPLQSFALGQKISTSIPNARAEFVPN